MITYSRLKQEPSLFKNLTGLSVGQFDTLYDHLRLV